MSMDTTKPLTLRLERTIQAPRARVFEAWTNPEDLQKWSAPEGAEIPEAEADVREGGRWRVRMRDAETGQEYVAVGVYREVTPPERLVYTHSWETDDTPVETLVTVEFHSEGDATRVVLVQEGFRSVGSRDGHGEGWSSTLDRLVAMFA